MTQTYATQKHPVGRSRQSSKSMINKFWSLCNKNTRMAFPVPDRQHEDTWSWYIHKDSVTKFKASNVWAAWNALNQHHYNLHWKHDYLLRQMGNVHTYLLTSWCRVLPEQLTGLQLVKKFPAFHWTWRFITALTSVRHLSLSWASPIQSTCAHPTSWRSILILSTHLRLGLPSGLFPSGFPTKTLYTPLSSPIRATCPAHLILLDFITRTILGGSTKHLSPRLIIDVGLVASCWVISLHHTFHDARSQEPKTLH